MAVAALLLVACVGPAEARLSVCNRSERAADVALGRYNGGMWRSEGWWKIGPNACADVIKSALDSRFYYLYASDGASGTWDGSKAFCTGPGRFAIVGRAHCAARGFDRKGFFEIDTGEKADWTQSLSD